MKSSKSSATIAVIILGTVTAVAVILSFICFMATSRGKSGNDFYIEYIANIPTSPHSMRITIVTIETRTGHPFDEINRCHNENVSRYASRHGYEYVFKTDYTPVPGPLTEDGRSVSPYWLKLMLVQDILYRTDPVAPNAVMWLDSDAIIGQTQVSLESVFDLQKNGASSVYIGCDSDSHVLCAGVFLIKNSTEGRGFVDACLHDYMRKAKFCYSNNHADGLNGVWAGPCYEQGVMNKRLRGEDKSILYVLPKEVVDNGGTSMDRAMILHYFGDKQKTLVRMRNMLGRQVGILGTLPKNIHRVRAAVLLTVHATESRQTMYMRRLEWWRASGLPIYLVCSFGAGHMGEDPNFLSFSQDGLKVTNNNTSEVERVSVLNAMHRFPLDDYDMLFKVTGTYIAPCLSECLSYILPTTDLVLQHRCTKTLHNTEIIGARPSIMRELMKYKTHLSLQKSLYKFAQTRTVQRLPPIGISHTFRTASNGITLAYL